MKETTIIITDKDIATIEAMHDLLLAHGYSLGEKPLKEGRSLTGRMYKALKYSADSYDEILESINKEDEDE